MIVDRRCNERICSISSKTIFNKEEKETTNWLWWISYIYTIFFSKKNYHVLRSEIKIAAFLNENVPEKFVF